MTARVRAARRDEYEVLLQLMRRAAMSHPAHRDKLLAHPEWFNVSTSQIRAGRILVAELDEVLVGFAAWLPIGDTTAELDGLFVDPSLWRSGVGTQLMDAVCDAVLASGLRNLFVISVPETTDFYRRCGFVRTGATATPVGPALTMMKEIAN